MITRAAIAIAAASLVIASDASAQQIIRGRVVDVLDWTDDAVGLRTRHYDQRTFVCPATADPTAYPVWGTGIYADHSSICAAAVHAGVITAAEGGPVTIQEVDGLEDYIGTTRNGITSQSLGAWYFSFQFVTNPN